MPYINQPDRQEYAPILELIQKARLCGPGELNYLITSICHIYLHRSKPNYERYNAIVGALESVKLEFYRRRVSGYEDEKIHVNGDV